MIRRRCSGSDGGSSAEPAAAPSDPRRAAARSRSTPASAVRGRSTAGASRDCTKDSSSAQATPAANAPTTAGTGTSGGSPPAIAT